MPPTVVTKSLGRSVVPAAADAEASTGSRVRVISVRVEDRPGSLQRITNCLGRRGLRLESCAVGSGSEQGVVSMSLHVDPGSQPPDQIAKQLDKLIDVVSVEDITTASPVEWATALVEINSAGDKNGIAAELLRLGLQLVHQADDKIIAAVSGSPEFVDSSLASLRFLPVVDWICSGPLALTGGPSRVADGIALLNPGGN